MGFLAELFGVVLNFIYGLVQNYGLAIILFSILLKVLILPITIKEQIVRRKMAGIQGKVKEIQKKYKKEPDKMHRETMELYKREKANPLSGCLPAIVQMLLIMTMFWLVRSPLTYMRNIDPEVMERYATEIRYEAGEAAVENINIEDIHVDLYNVDEEDAAEHIENARASYIAEVRERAEQNALSARFPEMSIIRYVRSTGNTESELYLNMNFLGLDLSDSPIEDATNPVVYIIPALFTISSVVSMKITMSITQKSKQKNEIVLDKDGNPEKPEPDMMTQMSKNMMWMMPIMMLGITFSAPLGLALYWLTNNVLMISVILLLNKFLFSKEDKKEEVTDKNE